MKFKQKNLNSSSKDNNNNNSTNNNSNPFNIINIGSIGNISVNTNHNKFEGNSSKKKEVNKPKNDIDDFDRVNLRTVSQDDCK